MSELAREMMAKVEGGIRLESAQEMTDEYRETLLHLLTMQADSELAGGYGYVPWITKAPTVEEKHVVAQIVKDELRHAAVMVRSARRPRVRRRAPRPSPRRDLHDAHRAGRGYRDRAHHERQAGEHLLLPDRDVGRFRLLQLLHGSGGRAPARGCPRLLLRPLGARDRRDLQGGEVPHPPRRVLGEEARLRPDDPRRGADDLQQVVRPDAEHLRAPGVAEEPALPEVPAQAPRQRRGPAGVRPRGPGALRQVRPHAPRVEAEMGRAPRRSPHPRLRGGGAVRAVRKLGPPEELT